MKKQFYSVILVAAALATIAGCNKSGSSSGNLAVVNGDAITMDDFHRYLEHKAMVQVGGATPGQLQALQQQQTVALPVAQTLGFQALEDLIRQQILLQIAKNDGAYPSKDAVEKELAHQLKQNPDFVRLEQSKGYTLEDIRQELLISLAEENIVTKGITVTDAEAQGFITKNQSSPPFSTPAQVKMLYIVLTDVKAKASADKDLASGKPFSTVAANYSIAKDARQNQGAFPGNDMSRFPPQLRDLINKTPEGKSTDWLYQGPQAGWVKFYVQLKTPPKVVATTPDMLEDVRRYLAKQRGVQSTDLGKQILAKMKTSTIDVQLPSLQQPWKTAFAKFTAEQEQTNPTGAAPGTPAPGGAPSPAGPSGGSSTTAPAKK